MASEGGDPARLWDEWRADADGHGAHEQKAETQKQST